MSHYRFITHQELDRIRQQRSMTPQGHYPPYKENEIICVFESDNVGALFNRYGRTLAELRDLAPGTTLIVIEVVGFIGRMELDQSQRGWPESRAIFESIPLQQLRVIAKAVVQDMRGGQVVLGPLQFEAGNCLA